LDRVLFGPPPPLRTWLAAEQERVRLELSTLKGLLRLAGGL
jgi:hypothetical protein